MGIDKQHGPGLGPPGSVLNPLSCSPVVTKEQTATKESVKAVLDAAGLNGSEIDLGVMVRFESLLQAFAILGLVEGTDFTHSIIDVQLTKGKSDRYSVFRITKYNVTILVCSDKISKTYIVKHIVEDNDLPIYRSKFPRDETELDGYVALRLLSAQVYYWRICEIVSGGKITYFTDLRKVRKEIKAFAKSIGLPEGDFQISISAAGRARAMTEYGEKISFLSYLNRYRKSLGKNADGLDDQSLRDSLLLSVGLLSIDKVRGIIEVNNGGQPSDGPMLDDVDLDLGNED